MFDTYGSLGAELSAESLPTLRELRYFCSPMGSKLDVLRSVMSRFGPQLELLDLRGSNRMSTFGSDGAVRGRSRPRPLLSRVRCSCPAGNRWAIASYTWVAARPALLGSRPPGDLTALGRRR